MTVQIDLLNNLIYKIIYYQLNFLLILYNWTVFFQYKYLINLVITNENKTKRLFENICTIEFLFPVFLSSTTSLDDIKLHNDERCNYYKDNKETEISLPLINESTFNYIWVPTILTTKGFSIIYKDSNLKVSWKLNKTAIRLDTAVDTDAQISYDRYISPWKYIGKISWIIK